MFNILKGLYLKSNNEVLRKMNFIQAILVIEILYFDLKILKFMS
jgi:hypothetical protein